MKTIIIIVLVIIIGLTIIGGGSGTFISNVGQGTEKIKQNEQLQGVKEQITSTIKQEVEKSEENINQMAKETQISTKPNNCDESYPDVCIPPYPPDLDCSEIQYANFKVLQPDPHGFDRDKDGIGCES